MGTAYHNFVSLVPTFGYGSISLYIIISLFYKLINKNNLQGVRTDDCDRIVENHSIFSSRTYSGKEYIVSRLSHLIKKLSTKVFRELLLTQQIIQFPHEKQGVTYGTVLYQTAK